MVEVLKSENDRGSKESDQEVLPGLVDNWSQQLIMESVGRVSAGTQFVAATIGSHL
jgi:hypothetical protein